MSQKKKLTVKKIDLANEKTGYAFSGKFIGTVLSAPFKQVDQVTGEIVEKQLTQAIFEDEKAERFSVIQDAGLRSAMGDAMVKEGDKIEVVKLEKSKLKGGRTMNNYDIFAV
jgi:hypothetical protein